MAFHEVQFSTVISAGSSGGPGMFVNIVQTDSGSNERNNRWPLPKRRYDARFGVRTQSDLYDIIEFFIQRDGPTNGFRWKDWTEYTTGLRGVAAPSATDEVIGTGTGNTQSFQLIKTYGKGTIYPKIRPIEKPVAGTVKVALDGVSTSAFTVDTTTGVVLMNTAPGTGVTVTAGCEFDVPVQFGEELAISPLQAALNNFDVGSISDIPIVEMNSGIQAPEKFYHGEGSTRVLSADSIYQWDWGLANVLVPTVAVKVFLPNPSDLETGINYPFFTNISTPTITFRDHLDQNTYFTLGSNSGTFTYIFTAGGVKSWGAASGS